MTRWHEGITGCVAGLLLAGSLYAAGFWWCVLPYRTVDPDGSVWYSFSSSARGRTLYYVYWPVIRADAEARVFWSPDIRRYQ